jgi:predicted permease
MAAALLFESAVPAILGGAAGLALAYAILRVFPSLIPEQLPLWMRFDLNPEVVAFTFAVTLFAALVAGVVPAISATRVNLVDVLKEGSRGSARGGKLRNALVVGEIALATVLLVGAGLLIQSFNKLLSVDPGFAPERVITVSVSPFRTGTNEDRIRAVCAYYQDAIRRLRELPGVIAAGATDNFPFTRQINERTTLNIEGKGDTLEAKAIRAPANFIDTTPDYFDAMGIRILEGRTYTENDDLTKPWVIMLSKRAADALFPGRSAVGQQVRAGTPGHFDPWATVVGVVANVKYRAQDDERTLEFYYPYKQYGLGTAHIALRVQGDPKALEPRIRAVLAEADPQTAVDAIKTMPTLIEDSLWQQRLWSLLLTGFAMVALLLAVVGIYGVMANFVSLRTREIGIRLAIGATPATILQSVTRHGLLLVAVGTSIGIAASLLAARFVESLLFGVRPADPLTLLGVPLILLLTGLLASLFPALRAANVDPVIALRRD